MISSSLGMEWDGMVWYGDGDGIDDDLRYVFFS